MTAALVVPVAAHHAEYGYALAEQEMSAAFALGCRGVYLTGGGLTETAEALARLRAASPAPLIAAAELACGAGERFSGATSLPPLAAFDANDLGALRRAARITAREARGAGINWVIAPSCIAPGSTSIIERARTFFGDDDVVSAACSEWIDACQAEGVVAMPGPYPHVRPAAMAAAFDAGAGAVLLAPSHAMNTEVIAYLRHDAEFGGVVGVMLASVAEQRDEDEASLAAACIAAGCDLLLGVTDTAEVVRALEDAVAHGTLGRDRVQDAMARVDMRAQWADIAQPGREPTLDDTLWARRFADACVRAQHGRAISLRAPVDVIVVDDDPPRREPAGVTLCATLEKLGADARLVTDAGAESRGTVVIALFGDRRMSLGFDAYSDGAIARVRDACARAERMSRDAIVVHFTPPDFVNALAFAPTVVCAWSGTRAMEEAAARWLARGATA